MTVNKKLVKVSKVSKAVIVLPKKRAYDVSIYPKPFEVKALAISAEQAMTEALAEFKAKNPEVIIAGINVNLQ